MSLSALTELREFIWYVFVVLLRVGPAIALSPGYGETSVPARVKLMISISLSVAIVPAAQNHLPAITEAIPALAWIIFSESFLGFFLGIVARGTLFLLQHAATVMSQSISLAQLTGNFSEALPVIGHFFTVAGLALITSGELGHMIIYVLAFSFDLSRDFLVAQLNKIPEVGAFLLNYVFNTGVLLAMGLMSFAFVYYLFIGFVNKSMPQLMVTFIGVPFVALVSIIYLHQTAEPILTVWQEKAIELLKVPLEGIK